MYSIRFDSIRKKGRGGPSNLYRHRKIAPSVKIPYSLPIELGQLFQMSRSQLSSARSLATPSIEHRLLPLGKPYAQPGMGRPFPSPLATGLVDLSIGGKEGGRVVPFLTHHFSLTHKARAPPCPQQETQILSFLGHDKLKQDTGLARRSAMQTTRLTAK